MPQVDGFDLLARLRAEALGLADDVQKTVDYAGFKGDFKAALVRQGCPAI
ncbi:hypothetical protein RCH14_001473 [Massilia sp. MP_M2]